MPNSENETAQNEIQPNTDGVLTCDNLSENSDSSVNIVAVGVRSAFWTIVALVLAFGCFLSFFPYTAMRMYSALDMKYMALNSAEKYMSRNEDEIDIKAGKLNGYGKYADALYLAVNNSVYLMDDAVEKYGYGSMEAADYAKKADKHITAYLACQKDLSMSKRTAEVDSYSLRNTSPAMHPYVYSYTDRLNVSQSRAQFVLGKSGNITTRANATTTYWGQETWELKETDYEPGTAQAMVANDFLFLSQLSAYINAELDKLGLAKLTESNMLTYDKIPKELSLYGSTVFNLFIYSEADKSAGVVNDKGDIVKPGEYTPLHNLIKKYYSDFVNYVKANSTRFSYDELRNINEHLKNTYYLKILSDFTYSVHNMHSVLRAKSEYFDTTVRDKFVEDYEDWHNNLQTEARIWDSEVKGYRTRNVSLTQWYNIGMLYDYLRFYRV